MQVRNLGNLTPLEQTPLASVGKNLEEKEAAAKPSRTLYNAISRAASEATTKMGAGNPLSSAFGQISVLEEKGKSKFFLVLIALLLFLLGKILFAICSGIPKKDVDCFLCFS